MADSAYAPAPPSKPLTDEDLKAILHTKIHSAVGDVGDKLSQARLQAERYYRGEKFGNEMEGRSRVVSRDVAEAIDSMMPALMKIFASGDEVVRFEPTAKDAVDPQTAITLIQKAEEQAKQATDYVNWIWSQQNEGFANFYAWFKSALMKRLGVVKIWWDEQVTTTKETYQALTDDELALLLEDEDVELIEETAYPDPMAAMGTAPPIAPPGAAGGNPPAAPPAPMPMLHDVVVRMTNRTGHVRVAPVPEDEFLTDHRAVTLENIPFLGHRYKSTVTDLIEMFPDKAEEIRSLPTGEEAEYGMERLERFHEEDTLPWREYNPADNSMREIWATECYIRVDYDGDGVAELRKVTVAGDIQPLAILDNEEIDNHPFAALTPVPMPHKLFGMSIADQTMDLQLIKSTLWRQTLDHTYNAITPSIGVVTGQVNLDDLLNRRPGGIVRMERADAVVDLPSGQLGVDPYQMIEYVDSVREQRTGVTRYNQGLDADSLNKTAKGINMIQQAGNERLELIARVFAETGVKHAFRRILQLVCQHQNKAKMIRLRGKWVPIDPREWSDEMDMTVTVGLGTGSRDHQMQVMSMLLNIDQEIVKLQGGISGPLVTGENIYNKLGKIIEFAGLKSVEPYYTDPKGAMQQQQPQRPDPKVEAAQIAAQADQAKTQAQIQADRERLQMQSQFDAQKMALQMQADQQQAAARMQLDREIAIAKIRAQQEVDVMRIAADREEFNAQAQLDMARQATEAALKTRQIEGSERARESDDDFRKRTAPDYKPDLAPPQPKVRKISLVRGADGFASAAHRHYDDGSSDMIQIDRLNDMPGPLA